MLIIIGESRSTKTITAKRLADTRKVISASGWIRDLYPEVNDPIAFSILSKERLRINPNICINYLRSRINHFGREKVIVEGLRNPRDLLSIIQHGDHILDLGGEGKSPFEITGLKAIRELKDYLALMYEVTWADYVEQNIILLPEPLKVDVFNSTLFQNADLPGVTSGAIEAFECYPGQPITAMFKAKEGGVYHDVPLESCITNSDIFSTTEDYREYLRSHAFTFKHSYAIAQETSPRLSITPFNGVRGYCEVFSPNREWIGSGKSTWILHWPQENLLLHLVELEGRLLFWPPHKLLWEDGQHNAELKLPDWKKNRGIL